ncbi:hypothetical protein DACRYDRAFT_105885 [Dacryopinax primogenitus]|uniref:FAD-binding domain-containing protein n=1 Tax=Dacryopinax primogenitus (strain DJM 731) TaxID=1858805 RepID=M5GF08_DACPD|nr:uncharacterized protein DACRYDRAFT_105885 [Dacryopinax primogenitus]EJU03728.1 hypothetical protein DACRYDRAFT_105885 [Dacryopinax primogenitus]
MAERLLEEGVQVHMLAFYNPRRDGKGVERTSRISDVNAPTARWQFEIALHQGKIESIFLEAMEKHGLLVERPYFPTALEVSQDEAELKDPTSYPVKVTVQRVAEPSVKTNGDSQASHNGVQSNVFESNTVIQADRPEETEIIRAKFVIGGDGAHSWVRKQLGFKMEGETTQHVWGVVDLVPETDFPDVRHRTLIHSDAGSCMIIPREGDEVRLYIQLIEGLDNGVEGRLDRSKVGPEKVMAIAKEAVKPWKMDFPNPISWWTVYVIGQMVANRFSAHERVFIAGHTHSPKAGQGMNASMNDTHNLSWKIAHVLRGWTNIDILKTYEFERKKFAHDLINFDKKLASMFSEKAISEDNLDGVAPEEFQDLLKSMGGLTSGIAIEYAPSLITDNTSQSFAPGLMIGQRVQPQIVMRVADCRAFEMQDLIVSDTKWKLLFFVGDPKQEKQAAIVKRLGEYMDRPDSFISKFSPKNDRQAVFTMLIVSSTPKDEADYTDIHSGLLTHWSKAFTDDISVDRKSGGRAYETYGVGKTTGAFAAVRPDGYVAYISSLEGVVDGTVDKYLSRFMIEQP